MASIFPSLTGLMGGFNEAHEEYKQQQIAEEQERNKRETAVFNTLLSSPDPEIQAMAATGMITGAMGPQRKSGIRGWIGDVTANPMMGKIRDYINSSTGTPSALPSRSITGTIPNEPGTAGQVATQTTRAGQPPPATTSPDQAKPWVDLPPSVGQPPPTAGSGGGGPAPISNLQIGPVSTPPPTHPRIFRTPEEEILAKSVATHQGDIQGRVAGWMAAGLSQQEAQQRVREELRRAGGGYGATGGLTPMTGKDAQGNRVQVSYDHRLDSPTYNKYIDVNGQEVPGFVHQSITTPRATDREGGAMELFGKPFGDLDADQAKVVNDWMVQFQGQKTGATTTARMGAEATGPLSKEQVGQQIEHYSTQWQQMNAPVREMQRNLLVARQALANFDRDPNGSSQAVLKAFETILDPRETGVRASDFGLTKQGQDLFDRAQAAYQRMIQGGGQGVTRENLTGLLSTAEGIVSGMQGFNTPNRDRIAATVKAFGIDPALVLGADYTPDAGTGKAPGTVGTPPPTGATGSRQQTPGAVKRADGGWDLIIR